MRARNGGIQIGIGKHDQRRFAAQLQRHILQRGRGIRHNFAARACPAGQRNLGNTGMAREHLPGFGKAVHHLKHALRHARLKVDLLQLDGR